MFSSIGYSGRYLYWEEPLLKLASLHDLKIFTGSKLEDHESFNSKKLRSISIQLKGRDSWNYSKHLQFYNPIQILSLVRKRPDLIIVNECTILSLFVILFSKLWDVRTLLLLENSHINYRRRRMAGLSRFLRRSVISRASRVLTNNCSGKKFAIDFGISEDRILVQPYLTSQVHCRTKIKGCATRYGRFKILFVGQLIERKGLRIFLESLQTIETTMQSRLELSVVGKGPQETLLKELAEKCSAVKTVFHGSIPYKELGSYYTLADFMLIPTLHDYRALVGFEALNCGLPILHSIYDGASQEVTDHMVTGIKYDPLDKGSFTHNLKLMLNDELLGKFRKNSEERAAKFSMEKITENFCAAIDKVLNT